MRTLPVTRREMVKLDDEYGLAKKKSSKPQPETVRQPIKKTLRKDVFTGNAASREKNIRFAYGGEIMGRSSSLAVQGA